MGKTLWWYCRLCTAECNCPKCGNPSHNCVQSTLPCPEASLRILPSCLANKNQKAFSLFQTILPAKFLPQAISESTSSCSLRCIKKNIRTLPPCCRQIVARVIGISMISAESWHRHWHYQGFCLINSVGSGTGATHTHPP